MNLLKKPIKRLLKDLDLDHVVKILELEGIPALYKKTFENILNNSKNSKYYDKNKIKT